MASLFDIKKVTIGEDKLTAHVAVNPGSPTMTSEDIEATARVYYLTPGIAKHLCLGDAGNEFQDCMGDTEMAHLLEHLSVEIMNETGLAGKIACGRTRVGEEERTWDVELSCPDDALTIGALSSATFMMDWAFLTPEQPAPDFDGTVAALKQLVLSLRPQDDADEQGEGDSEEPDTGSVEGVDAAVAADEAPTEEPADQGEPAAELRPEPAGQGAVEAAAVEAAPVPEPARPAEPDAPVPAPTAVETAAPVADPAPTEGFAPSPIVSPAVFTDDAEDATEPEQGADQA